MGYTSRFSEEWYPLVHEPADSFAAGTSTSSYVSLSGYHRAILVLSVGEMQANATLDASIVQATDTSGTGSKAITGKAITQLSQAGGDGDDLVCIELRTEELDVDNGFDCIAVTVTVGTAAVEYSYVLFGGISRTRPVPTTNWTEIVG